MCDSKSLLCSGGSACLNCKKITVSFVRTYEKDLESFVFGWKIGTNSGTRKITCDIATIELCCSYVGKEAVFLVDEQKVLEVASLSEIIEIKVGPPPPLE